ncbi:MAG: hypothetical protein HOL17_02250 [Gammaproteobacteria bacterium]|nr:hypothetical protein [Gammaproteobacteria bacterium]MBT4606855.1 hypothetical protein [Thiotrichales bacterium]MBT5370526.1 hypothetical protein [Gammaproteobacteria bacterium]MBT5634478.1 hypothetical protein [Gammaproteobacteria bacterium]MBT7830154.1 hypothetical protein [Candidatus Neomarinimicrobiota bacterium]
MSHLLTIIPKNLEDRFGPLRKHPVTFEAAVVNTNSGFTQQVEKLMEPTKTK